MTENTIDKIQKRIEGLDSYCIVTDRAKAEASGWINLLNDVTAVLRPFYETEQASSMFMGIYTTPDKKLAGVHFYATPIAAAAVLKAFSGYKLVDNNGNDIYLSKPSALKKPGGPKT